MQQCSELVIRNDINKAELFSPGEDDGIPIQSIKYTVSLKGIPHYQSKSAFHWYANSISDW
jgi:hypothetical protein